MTNFSEESGKIETSEQENLATIFRGVKTDLSGRVFNALIRYGYIILLARLFGPELLGIFFLGLIVIEFSGVLARLGFETGVLKYVSIYSGQGDSARVKGAILRSAGIVLLSSLIWAVLLFIGSDFLSDTIFHKAELSSVLKIFAFALPFSSVTLVLLSATQAFHTLKYRVIVEFVTNPVLNILLVILVYLAGYGIGGVVAAYGFSFAVCAVLSLFFVIKLFPDLLNPNINAVYQTRKLIRFSTPLILVNFLSLMMMWTDVLMLGYFRTAAEVGIYNTAVKTAFFINFVIMSFTSIFAPRISELYARGEIGQLEQLFKTVTRWIFGLSLPLFLMVTILAEDILGFFGAEFGAGSVSLILLALAHLVNASVGSVRYVLIMADREKWVLWNMVGVSLLNICLNRLFIPHLGMEGAAGATAIAIIVINFIMLFQVYYHLRIHPYQLSFLKPLLGGVVAAVVVLLGRDIIGWGNSAVKIAVLSFMLLAIFVAVLKLLKLDDQDRFILQQLRLK